jgi:hypothetical protein
MKPDPNAPQPGDPIVLAKFDGLKNTLQPERLSPRDLVRARNVTLDDGGQVSRRRGFAQKVSGNAHSLFNTSRGHTLAVINGTLGVLHQDYSFLALQTGIGTNPAAGVGLGLAYAQVGPQVYYTSALDSGIINLPTLTAGPWGVGAELWLSPVVNPTATLPAIRGQLLGKPPNATSLAYYRGRILLAQGNVLWATEPWLYNFVDKTAGYKQFEGAITLVGAVGDGVYVGTDEGLYFLSGATYPEWKKDRVMDSPVVPGSMVLIPAELGNPPQVPQGADTQLQVALMFLTSQGVCVASDGGTTTNITESKMFFPSATSAAAFYRRQDGMNQYIAAAQSGGTPTNNAAIGDYVSATIIRASAANSDFVGPTTGAS